MEISLSMNILALVTWGMAMVVALLLIGFHLGRKSRTYIPPPPQYPEYRIPDGFQDEPEGDLFNDALRGDDSEERIATV